MRRVGAMARTIWRFEPATVTTRYWQTAEMVACIALDEAGDLIAGMMSPPLVAGLVTQNGLAWLPDGRTMYLSDSHASRRVVWAFDYDVDSGAPSRRFAGAVAA